MPLSRVGCRTAPSGGPLVRCRHHDALLGGTAGAAIRSADAAGVASAAAASALPSTADQVLIRCRRPSRVFNEDLVAEHVPRSMSPTNLRRICFISCFWLALHRPSDDVCDVVVNATMQKALIPRVYDVSYKTRARRILDQSRISRFFVRFGDAHNDSRAFIAWTPVSSLLYLLL
jgi:hypothetical protein